MLEVVAILAPNSVTNLTTLGCGVRDLDRVRLDMDNLVRPAPAGLLQIDHEQSATLGDDVVHVANIPERVVELGRSETIDDVDHDLQRVGKLLRTFRSQPSCGSSGYGVRRPSSMAAAAVEIFTLDRDTSFDQVFELLRIRSEQIQLNDRVGCMEAISSTATFSYMPGSA